MHPDWHVGHVTVNGVKLHYHRTGGDKPVVILAHGITDSSLCWTRLVRALESSYDLILYDARGHGLSDQPGSYGLEDHVADMVGLIRALELESPFLLGHSMGGANIPFVAALHLDAPSGLLLEDPHWPAEPESSTTYDLGAWRNDLIADKAKPLEALLAAGSSDNPMWDMIDLNPWAEAKRQVDPDVVTWLHSYRKLNGWREIIGQVTCPVLLITGDTDVTVTPEVAREAGQLCPNLEVSHIKNAGHSIRRDQFEVYIESVRTFLDKVVLSKLS